MTNPLALSMDTDYSVTATFTATTAGSYKYICGVDSHYLDGMWGYFNVTV